MYGTLGICDWKNNTDGILYAQGETMGNMKPDLNTDKEISNIDYNTNSKFWHHDTHKQKGETGVISDQLDVSSGTMTYHKQKGETGVISDQLDVSSGTMTHINKKGRQE